MIDPTPLFSSDALVAILGSTEDATAIYSTEELTIQYANDAMINYWGKDREVIGQMLHIAVPELSGQPVLNLLKDVWRTGQTYEACNVQSISPINNILQTFYFDVKYKAIVDQSGDIYCILHTVSDVTERRSSDVISADRERLQQGLQVELAAINEKLRATNEEYQATNAQLNMLNKDHARINNDLAALNEEYLTANENLNLSNNGLIDFQNKLSRAEELLRFAVEAGNVGTWYINSTTREFIPSIRLKAMFGYKAEEEMPYDAALDQIRDTHRSAVIEAVEHAISKGEGYDIEYPITNFHNQSLRWVRAFGKLYPDTTGKLSHFSGIMIDITEQKADEQRKSDFIGMVSHELKTPLTSLGAYVQLLQVRAAKEKDEFSANALHKAHSQVKKMTQLVKGFLDVARFGSGQLYLNKQQFDLEELMVEIIDDITFTTGTAIDLTPCKAVHIFADREKVGQVINNLLSNAIKYSEPGKPVELMYEEQDAWITVKVKDQGKGIDEKDQLRLFERFYRAKNEDNKTIVGFGIGLYLCTEIVNAHHGSIGVVSEPGKGSTFWFKLPKPS